MAQTIVKIQRGRFSPRFQVARAWLSAASAIVHQRPLGAVDFIEAAIGELNELRSQILKEAK